MSYSSSAIMQVYPACSPVVPVSKQSPAYPRCSGSPYCPAGAVPPNPQELLGRAGFSELLQTLTREFDVVIIDTPAAREYGEAQIIASRASAALIVARKDRTSMPDTIELAESLQQTGTTPLGCVLNDF